MPPVKKPAMKKTVAKPTVKKASSKLSDKQDVSRAKSAAAKNKVAPKRSAMAERKDVTRAKGTAARNKVGSRTLGSANSPRQQGNENEREAFNAKRGSLREGDMKVSRSSIKKEEKRFSKEWDSLTKKQKAMDGAGVAWGLADMYSRRNKQRAGGKNKSWM